MNDMTLYVNNTTNQMHRKPERQPVLRQVLTNNDISLCVSSPHKLATNHSTLMTYIVRFITRFLIKISNNRHWIKQVASVRKLGYKMIFGIMYPSYKLRSLLLFTWFNYFELLCWYYVRTLVSVAAIWYNFCQT